MPSLGHLKAIDWMEGKCEIPERIVLANIVHVRDDKGCEESKRIWVQNGQKENQETKQKGPQQSMLAVLNDFTPQK